MLVVFDKLLVASWHVPILGLSLNQAYRNLPRGGRVRTKRHDAYVEKFVANAPLDAMRSFGRLAQAMIDEDADRFQVIMTLTFVEEFMCRTKKGPKPKDVTNLVKVAEDQIFKAIGIDDKWVFDARSVKMHSRDVADHGMRISMRCGLVCPEILTLYKR